MTIMSCHLFYDDRSHKPKIRYLQMDVIEPIPPILSTHSDGVASDSDKPGTPDSTEDLSVESVVQADRLSRIASACHTILEVCLFLLNLEGFGT